MWTAPGPRWLAMLLALLWCVGCAAPSPLDGVRVYVTSELSGRVHVIDAATHRSVGGIGTNGRARGIRLNADGSRAYVAVAESLTPTLGDTGTGRVLVLDTRLLRVLGAMPSATNTQHLALSFAHRRLFAPDDERRQLRVWDAVSGAAVDAPIATGPEPEAVGVSPDGQRVYVLAEGNDTVAIVDAMDLSVLRTVQVCQRPRGVAFSPDGALAYISCEDDATIAVLDAADQSLRATVNLGVRARPVGLVVAPDGRELYVATGRGRQVLVVDLASSAVIAAIDVGARPWHLALSPDGSRLYVANGPSDDVSVIDVPRRVVIETMRVEGRPWGIAIR